MVTLTKASRELYKRGPDETFADFDELYAHCSRVKRNSSDLWMASDEFVLTHDLTICDLDDGTERKIVDWSFSQLCTMASVNRGTLNRLSSKTASKAFEETLPHSTKPLQFLATEDRIRAIHGAAYTRLWNADLLSVVNDFAGDFTAPQNSLNGATGLYCGEQDMFAFMIDPAGWAEIDGEAFAPGFFVWNSEVGKRSLGVQTFWFQKVCQNHIVWDATEVVEFSRKHTANVADGLIEVRRILEQLAGKRNARRDSFSKVIKKAMRERLGRDAEEVTKVLTAKKLPKRLIADALEIAKTQGAFTIFSLVDALTQLSQRVAFAGDRTALDVRIGKLLALAA